MAVHQQMSASGEECGVEYRTLRSLERCCFSHEPPNSCEGPPNFGELVLGTSDFFYLFQSHVFRKNCYKKLPELREFHSEYIPANCSRSVHSSKMFRNVEKFTSFNDARLLKYV